MSIVVEDASAVPSLEAMLGELRALLESWIARGVSATRAFSVAFLAIARCMADARYPGGDVLASVAKTWADVGGRW